MKYHQREYMKGRIKPERRREDLTCKQEDPGTLARPFPGIGSSSLSRESACDSETSLSGFTTPGVSGVKHGPPCVTTNTAP